MDRREIKTIDLRQFSFLDFPQETIASLQLMSRTFCTALEARLNFEDHLCEDIGAFLLLESCWPQIGRVFHGGTIYAHTQRVLESVGLREAFGMVPSRSARSGDIKPFAIQKKSSFRSSQSLIDPSRSEKVSEHLCRWIDEVLSKVAKIALSDEGMSLVENITGEALNNAEMHGDMMSEAGAWTIAGFMSRAKGRCRFHLAFFSAGATIAESISSCPELVRAEMDVYISRHRNRRLSLSDSDLKTVFALQDGVTRLERKLSGGPGKRKGGTGLGDVIDFFSQLSGTQDSATFPKLAIVSGSTYIKISAPYNRALREGSASTDPLAVAPRRIWFNSGNTDTDPPDERHVFSLAAPIQGTLITMAFDLDAKYLTGAADEHD